MSNQRLGPWRSAVDRDPAFGGLGLPLVATICADHGWTVEGGRKVVWARVDYTRPEPSDAPPGARPRGASRGHSPTHWQAGA